MGRTLALLLAAALTVSVAGDYNLNSFATEKGDRFREVMQQSLEDSISELIKSYSYLDQSQERPGMGKLFREQSDKRWNQGVEMLKKYVKRGGVVNITDEQWAVHASKSDTHGQKTYMQDLESLVTSAEKRAQKLQILYKETTEVHDPDIIHFIGEKMEDEIKNHNELDVLKNILSGMKDEQLAMHFFDEHLL